MFPTMTSRPKKRSLRELVREAVGTAVEFATLGEASIPARDQRRAPTAPTHEHPHRRHIGHHQRTRRPGTVSPRAQVCVTPALPRPAHRKA
jgi:hypothetical protein